MSVLEFSRVYNSSGSVESLNGSGSPLLPVTFPDLPFSEEVNFRILPEVHPNLLARFVILQSYVAGVDDLTKRNVELVGRVNSLNAVNAVLSADLIKAKRANTLVYFLLVCSSLVALLPHLLR